MLLDPQTADWSKFSDFMVYLAAQDGVPQAIEEWVRRAKEGISNDDS